MAPKRQAITDADRRNIRRRRAETGETQAQHYKSQKRVNRL